jgi:hypothetical protein
MFGGGLGRGALFPADSINGLSINAEFPLSRIVTRRMPNLEVDEGEIGTKSLWGRVVTYKG